MARRQALGRGLDDLLTDAMGSRRSVPIDQIAPNPRQPRRAVDGGELGGLVTSIRRHGVLQPLIVTRDAAATGRFVLVAGERRWRAAQRAGLAEVPVTIVTADDAARLELALVENLQREDLPPLDRARAYRALMQELDLSQTEVARRLGMSRPAVANSLRLLELDTESRRELEGGRISEGHARALLGVPAGLERARMLEQIVGEALSVRAAERRARGSAGAGRRPKNGQADLELERLAERLQRRYSTRVLIRGTAKSGRIVIEYYSADELDTLAGELLGKERFT